MNVQAHEVCDDARNEVFGLSEDGRLSTSDVAGDKELKRIVRDLAERSLYFFAKAVLGYKDLVRVPHLRLCNATQDYTHKWQAMFLPRGVFKTTIRTIADTLFHGLAYPNDTNLIISQTDVLGDSAILEMQQAHLEGNNPMMNWICPEMVKGGDKIKPWNSSSFNFPHRTRFTKAPSVASIGMLGRLEGQHFTILRVDDPIGEEDLNQPASMAAKIAKYSGIYSYFERVATGVIRLSGTRWGTSDLYSLLEGDGTYEVISMPAEDPVTGELLFPTLITRDFLDMLRRTDYTKYLTQYMNDVTNPRALEFSKDWLREYQLLAYEGEPACFVDGEYYKVSDGDVVLAVDPASSGDAESVLVNDTRRGKAKKSNNAAAVWLKHRSGRHFLLDYWVGRTLGKNPELQLAEETLTLYMRWRGFIRRGFVESFGAQRAFITIFEMVCKSHGVVLPFGELPRGIQKAKKVRIRTYMGAAAENGMIFIRRSHTRFEYEFTHFGQMDQIDLLDASAWCFYAFQPLDDDVTDRAIKKQHERNRNRIMMQVSQAGY